MKQIKPHLFLLAACSLCLQQLVHASKVLAPSSTVEAGSNANSNFGQVVPEAEQTIQWIKEHGGQVNVIVRHTPDSGRAVFAPQDVKKGDVLAAIPFELCYLAADDVNADVQFAALKLAEDLADSNHTHQSYFVSLPPRNGVWSMHDIPTSYLPLIQSKNGALEKAISSFQERLQMLWEMAGSRSPLPGTFDDLKFALAQLMTRLFQFEGIGLLMIPLVDMGNHRNDCRNTHRVEPCPFDSTRDCMMWRAQHDIPQGGEVCNFYKFMLNDRSLLQYGFLQGDATAYLLSGVDRHDFNTTQPWQDLPTGEHGPLLFEGSPAEIRDEMSRLTQLRASLQEADMKLKPNTTADPEDTDGWFLSLMWEWRQQRQDSIEREINRLERQLQRLETSWQDIAAWQTTYDRLDQWLKDQGAQVNVQLRAVEAPFTINSNNTNTCHSPSPNKLPMKAPGLDDSNVGQNKFCESGLSSNASQGQDAVASAGPQVQSPPRTGVFTMSAVKEGDMLAVIPLALAHRVKEGNQGLLESVVELLLSASKANLVTTRADDDMHRPFVDAMPKLGEVRGLYNFPTEYLPLIQNEPMETHIRGMQAMLKKEWDTRRPVIQETDDSLTLTELQHMASWVTSRSLSYDEGTFLMPLMSMTSTLVNNECVHYDYIDKCPGSETESCVFWVAGADMAANEEVCISYGYVSPDIAVLQYGGQPQPTQQGTSMLLAMDHHLFNAEQPFAPLSSTDEAPKQFEGSAEKALAEVARLSIILSDLSSQDVEQLLLSQQHPVPSDVQGRLLDKLLWLAEYRVAALDGEVQRLMRTHQLTPAQVAQAVHVVLQFQENSAELTSGDGQQQAEHLSQESKDPWSKMIAWMRSHGALVNVRVEYDDPSTGRVVVADKDLRRGSLIAAIPLKLAFSLEHHGGNETYELAAANLFDAMSNPQHELQPYLASLPRRNEILCPLVDMPSKYLPLIHNKIAEAAVLQYQQRIQLFWDSFQLKLQSILPDMTIDDLKYTRSLIATRVFKHTSYGEIMIPLLDMANHHQDCPHIQTLGPCPADATQECLLWHAGSSVLSGQEVCNYYKAMRNDQSFLQYGFVQKNNMQLHNMDRHDFVNTSSFWSPSWRENSSYVESLPDDEQAKLQEVVRLQKLANLLSQTPQAPKNAFEQHLLDLLTQWRDDRASAINVAIVNIKGSVSSM